MPPARASCRVRTREPRITSQELDSCPDDPAVVLVIGMDHHDVVGTEFQGQLVAGLLVAAVTLVLLVDDDLQAHAAGDIGGGVAAAIVDEDDLIDDSRRDVGDGPLQRGGCVISGHDRHHLAFGRAIDVGLEFVDVDQGTVEFEFGFEELHHRFGAIQETVVGFGQRTVNGGIGSHHLSLSEFRSSSTGR
jgi:hypothetical protein